MAKNNKEKQKEYDAKRAGKRTRNWTVIFYPEDLPENWQEQVDSLLVRWIESPLHDSDFNDDGTPKKPHVHTLFMFESVKTSEQVRELFRRLFGASESGSTVGVANIGDQSAVSDRGAVVRYMAHLDHPTKAQYSVEDIVGHNGADPLEIMRFSLTETLQKMIQVEELIDKLEITEYSDLCRLLRNNSLDLYQLVVTRNTVHFRTYVTSNREKLKGLKGSAEGNTSAE